MIWSMFLVLRPPPLFPEKLQCFRLLSTRRAAVQPPSLQVPEHLNTPQVHGMVSNRTTAGTTETKRVLIVSSVVFPPSGLTGRMRTLSLGSGGWDCEGALVHLQEGWGRTWSKRNCRHHSTEEEEDEEEVEEDEEEGCWSSAEMRRFVFARTHTPGSGNSYLLSSVFFFSSLVVAQCFLFPRLPRRPLLPPLHPFPSSRKQTAGAGHPEAEGGAFLRLPVLGRALVAARG